MATLVRHRLLTRGPTECHGMSCISAQYWGTDWQQWRRVATSAVAEGTPVVTTVAPLRRQLEELHIAEKIQAHSTRDSAGLARHLQIRCGVSPRIERLKLLFGKELMMPHRNHQSCIEACVRCAQECEHCATACLHEQDVKAMAYCIQLDRDCAEICWTAAAYMSRGSDFAAEICRICADVCDACGAECERHDMDHCRVCAEACRQCAEECRRMVGAGV